MRKCPYCGKELKDFAEYVEHYRNNHKKIPKDQKYFHKFRTKVGKKRRR